MLSLSQTCWPHMRRCKNKSEMKGVGGGNNGVQGMQGNNGSIKEPNQNIDVLVNCFREERDKSHKGEKLCVEWGERVADMMVKLNSKTNFCFPFLLECFLAPG